MHFATSLATCIGVAEKANDSEKPKTIQKALEAHQALLDQWHKVMTLALAYASTTGDLGTIANLELHTRKTCRYLTNYDERLEGLTGKPFETKPTQEYTGKSRVIVPVIRNLVENGEMLQVKVITLSAKPMTGGTVLMRNLGHGKWNSFPLVHVNRGVWKANFPAAKKDFEYYIQFNDQQSGRLCWPVSSPQINQTVVVCSP